MNDKKLQRVSTITTRNPTNLKSTGAQLGILEGRGFSRKKGRRRTQVGVKGAEPPGK